LFVEISADKSLDASSINSLALLYAYTARWFEDLDTSAYDPRQ
jgi:hypothetical protein